MSPRTVDDLDIAIGDPSYVLGPDEGVILTMVPDPETGQMRPVILPRSIRDASPAQMRELSRIQEVTSQIALLSEELDGLVDAARDAGASWSAIGWCVGTTPQAARKRWVQ